MIFFDNTQKTHIFFGKLERNTEELFCAIRLLNALSIHLRSISGF